MQMLKRKVFLSAAAGLWALVVVSTATLTGVTVASYAGSASGTSTVSIAKWAPNIPDAKTKYNYWYKYLDIYNGDIIQIVTQPTGQWGGSYPAFGSSEQLAAYPSDTQEEYESRYAKRKFMYFKDVNDTYTFQFKLINKSEVTARYVVNATVDKGSMPTIYCYVPPKGSYGPSLLEDLNPEGLTYYNPIDSGISTNGEGVVIPRGKYCYLNVLITPAALSKTAPPEMGGGTKDFYSFTGLHLTAHITQVD
jgi:hypothetical protein